MQKIIEQLEKLPLPKKETRDVTRLLRDALIACNHRKLTHQRVTAILTKANIQEPSRREAYQAGLWLRNNGYPYATRKGRGGYWVPEQFNAMPPSYPSHANVYICRTVTALLRELGVPDPTLANLREIGGWLREKGVEQTTSGYKMPACWFKKT